LESALERKPKILRENLKKPKKPTFQESWGGLGLERPLPETKIGFLCFLRFFRFSRRILGFLSKADSKDLWKIGVLGFF